MSKVKSATRSEAFTRLEKKEDAVPGWHAKVRIGGEILFLVWVMGIFFYFYQKQGFFGLIQYLIQEGL